MFEPYIKSAELHNVTDFSAYPFNIAAVKFLKKLEFTAPVTFFIGENGSGKSTLLEAIAVAHGFNPEGGTRNFRFSTRSSHSSLCYHLRLSKGGHYPRDGFFLRAESYYNVATEIERMDSEPSFEAPVITHYGGVPLHEQSHGQSFLALLKNRLGGNGIYIFDEPEAALSPVGQFTMLRLIRELAEHKRSQFIIATHSPLLLAYPGASIFEFSDCGIRSIEYKLTDNYLLYKRFLTDDQMIADILE
jgi:predicted ATPase